jgi:hypothetical protein
MSPDRSRYAFTPKTSFSGSQRLYGGKSVERAFIGLLLDEVYPGLTDALPSLTWWAPSGPWAKITHSPKMLIFSRFRATPQSLAALVSLEVERKYVGRDSISYAGAWKKRHLNPEPNQGPTLALFHPSPFLIRAVDPLDARDRATVKQIRARARQQIIKALPASIGPEAPNARSNRRRKPAWAILAAIERAQKGANSPEFGIVQKTWKRVAAKDATIQSLIRQRDDADPIKWLSSWELDALVDMALGAPGVVLGRALYRHLPELFDFHPLVPKRSGLPSIRPSGRMF